MRPSVADLPMLVTPKQAAEVLGPSVSQVRGLIRTGKLAHIMVGSRVMIPRDAIERFTIDNMVTQCRDETRPRLQWHRNRKSWYIVYTERGRSRERSAGTKDRGEAEIALADFIHQTNRGSGPRDPAQILVTDILPTTRKTGKAKRPRRALPQR